MNTQYRRNRARSWSIAMLGLAGVVLASPCLAQTVVTTEVPVSLADLDLRSVAGRTTLHDRIEAAVIQACFKPQPGDLEDIRDYKACRKAAFQDAMAQAEVRIAAASGVQLSAR